MTKLQTMVLLLLRSTSLMSAATRRLALLALLKEMLRSQVIPLTRACWQSDCRNATAVCLQRCSSAMRGKAYTWCQVERSGRGTVIRFTQPSESLARRCSVGMAGFLLVAVPQLNHLPE